PQNLCRTLLALPLGELSAATPTERAGRVRTPVRTVLKNSVRTVVIAAAGWSSRDYCSGGCFFSGY
ncbi:MAG: hypothetical protein FWH14_08445, partial [Oscillospiraceae bacterium]|nr:hypothetical protein [Oscillospiraceae bacterium]